MGIYAPIIADAAVEFDLDPCLIHAVITVESSWRKDAVSSCGAAGLMQIMPKTFVSMSQKLRLEKLDIWDPKQNIRCGAYYLRRQYDKFPTVRDKTERWKFAVACYNCGAGYVQLAMRLAEIRHGKSSAWWDVTKAYLRDERCVIKGEDPDADQVIAHVDRVMAELDRCKGLAVYAGKRP